MSTVELSHVTPYLLLWTVSDKDTLIQQNPDITHIRPWRSLKYLDIATLFDLLTNSLSVLNLKEWFDCESDTSPC